MKSLIILVRSLLLALACGVAGGAAAQTVFVIANSGTQVAAGEVSDVFLGEKQFAGSTKLVPVDNAPCRKPSSAKALGLDSGKYNARVGEEVVPRRSQPARRQVRRSRSDGIRQTNAGAIGYVGSAPTGVTVVTKY